MASVSTQNFASAYSAKVLCQLVGLACIAGFIVDLLVLTFPPAFTSLEWRVGFTQQLSDRGIILLFGLALLVYGTIDRRRLRQKLVLFCLLLGVIFNLSCILVVRDTLKLQEQASITISNQASAFQLQIQKAQANPSAANVTPEQIQQASKQLSQQADAARRSTKASVLKTGISSVGNLVVVGLALMGLGQIGSRLPRS